MMDQTGGVRGQQDLETAGEVQQQDLAGGVAAAPRHPQALERGSGWAEVHRLLQGLWRYLDHLADHLARLLKGARHRTMPVVTLPELFVRGLCLKPEEG